jgi:hypothetical protein
VVRIVHVPPVLGERILDAREDRPHLRYQRVPTEITSRGNLRSAYVEGVLDDVITASLGGSGWAVGRRTREGRRCP